jgi:transposase
MSSALVALPAEDVATLEQLLKASSRADEAKAIQCVLLRARDQRLAEEIAVIVGIHSNSVRRIWRRYLESGLSALTRGSRGKHRSHENLSALDERAFLAAFYARAEAGEVVTVRMIREGYEQQVGHKTAHTTVYRLLKRQGWRKVVPRPKHPRQNQQEQTLFKKTERTLKKDY